MILTTVHGAYLDRGTPRQAIITEATAKQQEQYMKEGRLRAASMPPKTTGAIRFVNNGAKGPQSLN